MAERFKVGEETQKSGGDPNILQLKDQTKIRLLDDSGAGGIAWRQHTIKHADDSDQVEFAVCPGPKLCPLCRKPTNKEGKQNFPVSKRFATNVWDYGSSSVKVLIAGPQVFDEFKAAQAVNIDPTSCDWLVHKMGKGIQTKYKMVRDNASPFQFADQVGPDAMINLDKYGADTAPEKIFELLEKAGIDYDAIETQTFTLEEAMEFVLPFGRCKGLTVEQALAQDQEWCEWLHGTMRDEERFNEPVFMVLQIVMESRGLVGPVDETGSVSQAGAAPANDETPVEETAPTAAGPEMVTLIATDGTEQEVPKEAEAALLAAGYTVKEEPEPKPPAAPEVTYPVMLKGPDGSEVPAPTAEAAAAMESAGFTRVEPAAAAEEPPPAEEPAPTPPEPTPVPADRSVTVTMAGSTLPMPFKAALTTARAGTPVTFTEEDVDAYAQLLISTGGEPPESAEAPAQSAEMDAMHKEAQDPQPSTDGPRDPEKPFECQVPGCEWAGKTQGSLTQHMNREHADAPAASPAAPQATEQPGQATPPPSPAAAAPAPAGGDVRERVKMLLAKQPSKDYKKLLALFEEVAGKRDISKFTDEELAALEAKLLEQPQG